MKAQSLQRILPALMLLLGFFFVVGSTSLVQATDPKQWCVSVLNINGSGETYVVRQQCFESEDDANNYFSAAQADGYRKILKMWQLDTGAEAQGHIRFMGPLGKPCSAGYTYKIPDLSTLPYLSTNSEHPSYDNNIERVLGDVTTMGCSEVKLWDGANFTGPNLLTYVDSGAGTSQCWDTSFKHSPCLFSDITTSLKVRAH